MSSAENVVGTVELHASARLVFSVTPWQGRMLASVRKFVSTPDYEGPTKSGLAMSGDVLVEVLDALGRLQAHIPGNREEQFARVSKTSGVDVVITLIPPDALNTLPAVDIREYVDSPNYTGPTKKGVRFGWSKLPQVIALMQTQAQRLGVRVKEQATGPPKLPQSGDTPEGRTPPGGFKPGDRDAILAELAPGGPKPFPQGFLDSRSGKTRAIDLPADPIEVAQLPDGCYVVRSHLGFCVPVRNPAEGHFLLYAHLRGQRRVELPEQMIDTFKAVKAYENYVRELRRSLVLAYERTCGYRPAAEHQAREVFKSRGLPWLDD